MCLKDLSERFAKIKIQASTPIVPFRETISNKPASIPESDVTETETEVSSQMKIRISCKPISGEISSFLYQNSEMLGSIIQDCSLDVAQGNPDLAKFWNTLRNLCWENEGFDFEK